MATVNKIDANIQTTPHNQPINSKVTTKSAEKTIDWQTIALAGAGLAAIVTAGIYMSRGHKPNVKPSSTLQSHSQDMPIADELSKWLDELAVKAGKTRTQIKSLFESKELKEIVANQENNLKNIELLKEKNAFFQSRFGLDGVITEDIVTNPKEILQTLVEGKMFEMDVICSKTVYSLGDREKYPECMNIVRKKFGLSGLKNPERRLEISDITVSNDNKYVYARTPYFTFEEFPTASGQNLYYSCEGGNCLINKGESETVLKVSSKGNNAKLFICNKTGLADESKSIVNGREIIDLNENNSSILKVLLMSFHPDNLYSQLPFFDLMCSKLISRLL